MRHYAVCCLACLLPAACCSSSRTGAAVNRSCTCLLVEILAGEMWMLCSTPALDLFSRLHGVWQSHLFFYNGAAAESKGLIVRPYKTALALIFSIFCEVLLNTFFKNSFIR
jgi:hypothetical protein